jgi:hypothetical protein
VLAGNGLLTAMGKNKGRAPMSTDATCGNTGIHHVGLCAKDLAATTEFYRDVMGMQIVGGSSADYPVIGASVFLSSRPDKESHEIALFTKAEFQHIAFKVASLSELRSAYRRICGVGCSAPELWPPFVQPSRLRKSTGLDSDNISVLTI